MAVPTKYLLKVIPNPVESTYEAEIEIHVKFEEPIQEITLRPPGSANIEDVSFFFAQHIYRGNPNYIGKTVEFARTDNLFIINLGNEISPESAQEGAYIFVKFSGNIEDGSPIFFSSQGVTELNQKDQLFFPVFIDNPETDVQLTVVTDYRAGVEPSEGLIAGDHYDYPEIKFANVFKSENPIQVSEISFKISAPTPLILH
ncbi:unnamed protein product [Caenorhabditis angaria]|uniref:Uncharacterized protein n=1 Tax=Caenorhabditis angaria TaxID=860376 RepID=A0A9P1IXF6_9PELO|nr:unnamed protein product [Caenorhabditis angaria]